MNQPKTLNWGLCVLRVAVPMMMLLGHGLGKFNKLLAGGEIKFADPIGLGPSLSFILVVVAEFGCMIPVILGFYSRFFLIPAIINMGVAGFIFHANDPFGTKEKALLFFIVFVVLFLTGPGALALQTFVRKKSFNNSLLNFIFRY